MQKKLFSEQQKILFGSRQVETELSEQYEVLTSTELTHNPAFIPTKYFDSFHFIRSMRSFCLCLCFNDVCAERELPFE